MGTKKENPLVQLFHGDGKLFTKFFNGTKVQKVFCQNLKYKEKAVGTVWDYKIRQDGMGGTAAVALKACNRNFVADRTALHKINQITPVIAVYMEVSGGITNRAGFKFRSEKRHKTVKKRF